MRCFVRVAMLVAILLATATLAQAQEVTLSVAISMKDAVEELGKGFMAGRSGCDAALQLRLVRRAAEADRGGRAGRPVHLGRPAPDGRARAEAARGSATRRVFARNVLTVIKPADSKIDIAKPADLLDARVTKIVIGNPKTVPAGQYAEESLKALGLWDKLQPKLVFSENVRQALDYVARGEVDAGFRLHHRCGDPRPAGEGGVPAGEDTYRPVLYPAAVVTGAKQATLAQAFLDLLLSREGQAMLGRLGFQPPPAGVR